jgi:hypothetical protein
MAGTVGHPCFEATPYRRRKVERLAAKGMSQVEIALLIGCSRPVLAKYFSEELARGHARCRRNIIDFMWAAAGRGKVAAMIWLERRTREVADRSTGSGQERPLGKKAQAKLDAQHAGKGTAWETLLQPGLPPKVTPN